MTKAFIQLPPRDRAEILQTAAAELGFTAQVLEKDIWVCWVLSALFSMPDAHPMAFKGGTSLSKIWKAIDRFSEDVDITIDYRAFDTGFDHQKGKLSNTKQEAVNSELRRCVTKYLDSHVRPYMLDRLSEDLDDQSFELMLSDCGEKLVLNYPKAPVGGSPYIHDSIVLEFGGRNTLEPSEFHTVTSYLSAATQISGVHFPKADGVKTISVERTFWEKVTLAHASCGKDPAKARAGRMSRHWYDLAMLIDRDIVNLDKLLEDDLTLREVIALKNVFYYAASANYDACISGSAKLIPEVPYIDQLEADYSAMREDYILGNAPTFHQLLETVQSIQVKLNGRYT